MDPGGVGRRAKAGLFLERRGLSAFSHHASPARRAEGRTRLGESVGDALEGSRSVG